MIMRLIGAVLFCACVIAQNLRAAEKNQGVSGIPEIIWWQCAGDLSAGALEKKAAGGDAHAKAQLAYRMIYSREFEPDRDMIYRLFKESAGKGDSLALAGLAYCHGYAIGCERDMDLEFKYAKASADAGDPQGMYQLSLCYQYGNGVAPDKEMFLRLAEKSAVAGNPWAQYWLAMQGVRDPARRKKSIGVLEGLAERDFPVAIMERAFRKMDAGDDEGAMVDLGRSARMGLAYAMTEYGEALIDDGNIAEGVEWIMESIERGGHHGPAVLGNMIYGNTHEQAGRKQNIVAGSKSASFHYLDEAYRRGSKDAKLIGALAAHHVWGRGTEKNDAMAQRLIEEAWQISDMQGITHICQLATFSSIVSFDSDPPRKDVARAIAYEKYRQHPSATSVTRMGWYYSLADHKGTYDPVRAWAAVLTARSKGYDTQYLKLTVKNLEGKLDAGQIAEATKLSESGFPIGRKYIQEGATSLGRPMLE